MQDYIIPQRPALQVFPQLTELCSVEPAPKAIAASGIHYSIYIEQTPQIKSPLHGPKAH